MPTVDQHFQDGNLTGAIEVATAAVRAQPTAPEHRLTLAELLCFRGEFDRADQMIDAAQKLRPTPTPGLVLFRQLLRGEVARHQFYDEGRLPEFCWEPDESERAALEAAVELRGGRADSAAAVLFAEDRQPAACTGTLTVRSGSPQPFDSFRDLDDIDAPFVEALSATGKYFKLPWSHVRRLTCSPVAGLRDLLWRAASITNTQGETSHWFLPCLYAGTWREADDQLRLGRRTDWRDAGGGITRGVGLRMFLAGEETPSVLDLEDVTFNAGDAAEPS